METILIKGVQLILSLSILVFIHELGHFFWSRLFKVKVDKFYLFFDTEKFALIRFTPAGRPQSPALINVTIPGGDTEYGIGWIPLGGYCKIAGMVDESMDKEQLAQEPKPWEFRTQTAGKRFMIMVGGVLNNMLLAIFIYICMAWYWGKDVVYMRDIQPGMTYSAYAHEVGFWEGDIVWEVAGEKADVTNFRNELLMGSDITVKRGEELVTIRVPDTIGQFFLGHPEELASFATAKVPMVVEDVVLGGPAARAGMQAGDSIVAVNGTEAPYVGTVSALIAGHPDQEVTIGFCRNGERMEATLTLNEESKMGISYMPMNIADYVTHISYNFLEAIPAGIVRGWDMLYNYVRQFKLVFTPEGAKSLGGFGTMASIFPEAWDWYAFWAMTAFFSVALAFMNILPIPALDGGHIMFLVVEIVTGRKPSDRVLEIAQYIGFGIVIALLIFVNANDLYKFVIKPFLD